MGMLGSISAALQKAGQNFQDNGGFNALAAAFDETPGAWQDFQSQRQKNAMLLQQQAALKSLMSQMGQPDRTTGTLNEMIGANNTRLPVEQQSPLATPHRAGLDWTNPETVNAFSNYIGAGGSAALPMGIAESMKPEDPKYMNTGEAVIRIGPDGQAAPIWQDAPKALPAPAGYRWQPNGNLLFIPGGPGDPKTVHDKSAAGWRPRVGRTGGVGGVGGLPPGYVSK